MEVALIPCVSSYEEAMLKLFNPEEEVMSQSDGAGSGVVLTATGTDEEQPSALTPQGVLFAILSQRLHVQWAAELAQAQHDALVGYMKHLPCPGKATRMAVTYQPKEDVLCWEGIVSPTELIVY